MGKKPVTRNDLKKHLKLQEEERKLNEIIYGNSNVPSNTSTAPSTTQKTTAF